MAVSDHRRMLSSETRGRMCLNHAAMRALRGLLNKVAKTEAESRKNALERINYDLKEPVERQARSTGASLLSIRLTRIRLDNSWPKFITDGCEQSNKTMEGSSIGAATLSRRNILWAPPVSRIRCVRCAVPAGRESVSFAALDSATLSLKTATKKPQKLSWQNTSEGDLKHNPRISRND